MLRQWVLFVIQKFIVNIITDFHSVTGAGYKKCG